MRLFGGRAVYCEARAFFNATRARENTNPRDGAGAWRQADAFDSVRLLAV